MFKLKEVRNMGQQFNYWMRNDIIRVLESEGWKEFFVIPRSLNSVIDYFSYSDKDYLLSIIEALQSDGTIKQLNNGKYQLEKPLVAEILDPPSGIDESILEVISDYANFIPKRLNGEFFQFSGSFNLFNWDDFLGNLIYEVYRKAAFTFTPEALDKPGKLLDGGCGIGHGTAAIWIYNYEKGNIFPNTKLKLYGIDNNEDFINIASNEFDRLAASHEVISKEKFSKYKEFYPEFKVGSISDIPYEDDFFDYVFMSQVLHWTDTPKVVSEVSRVLRPGGIFFGTNEITKKKSTSYISALIKVIEGARGTFTLAEMKNWLVDAGFSKIKFATPLRVFRAIKV